MTVAENRLIFKAFLEAFYSGLGYAVSIAAIGLVIFLIFWIRKQVKKLQEDFMGMGS